MRSAPDIVAYVEAEVRRSGVLGEGEALLTAVSGGQDSCAMLVALSALAGELRLRLVVGHVNHGLRGAASDADAAFVAGLAERLGLACRIERLGLAPGSSEAVAREARFAALRRMADAEGVDRIALGHTATDRAETVLMNILRGAGLDGLGAMAPAAGDIIRPILGLTRENTAAYCAARGVEPRRDETNLDQGILRNRIRLSLLPLLEREYRPGVAEALVRLAEIAAGELEWTEPLVRDALGAAAQTRRDGLALDAVAVQQMPTGLRRRVLREAVAQVRGGLHDFGLEHLDALNVLAMEGHTGQRADLPGLWAERNAASVVLLRERPAVAPFEVRLAVPGRARVEQAGIEVVSELLAVGECDPAERGPLRAQLDAAATGCELLVRSPRPGDRIVPLGMQGTRKLHDFLIDKKIPRADREGMPVVATTQGEVLWIVGHRISERAKIRATTQQVAKLTVLPL